MYAQVSSNTQKIFETNSFSAMERERQCELCEEALRGAMLQIITLVNTRNEHIPPVTFNSDEAMLFPYKVNLTAALKNCQL
jgi:hypothetical protein